MLKKKLKDPAKTFDDLFGDEEDPKEKAEPVNIVYNKDSDESDTEVRGDSMSVIFNYAEFRMS